MYVKNIFTKAVKFFFFTRIGRTERFSVQTDKKCAKKLDICGQMG